MTKRLAALLKTATAEAPAITATLKSLVEIETGTGDAEGMASMGRYLESAFTARGGTVARMQPTGGMAGDIIVARWKGTGKGKLLLIALVLLHLLAIIWHTFKGRAIVGAMIHGDKPLEQATQASRDDWRQRLLAAATMALCVAASAWVFSLAPAF